MNLLQTPAMRSFEERHGYRTSTDSNSFVKYMAHQGITVPSLGDPLPPMQTAIMLQESDLQALINAVFPFRPSS